MDILSNLLWTLNFLTVIYKVKGYANGNFPQACESMLVDHVFRGVVKKPQTTDPPFEVEPVITGPDLITVTLQGETPFRGFMLEARDETDSIVGNFIVLDAGNTRLLDCNGLRGSAASQRVNNQKNIFRVNWTSNTNNLDVTFSATFVKDVDTFWNPIHNIKPSVKPSTTPGITNPTDTTVTTVTTTTESTTKEQPSSTVTIVPTTTESTTKGADNTTTVISSAQTSSTVVNSTTRPHTTDESSTASAPTTPPPNVPQHIRKYVPQVVAEVFLGTFIITVPAVVPSNANNHQKMKWLRRCGSILTLALELTASILLFLYDNVLKLKIIALFMSVTGGVTLGFAFWDVRRSHELWPLYDTVIDILFVIQSALGIAFTYCSTGHCQSWLLYVLISFTVWVLLQTICIFTVKIIKVTGSRKKKGIDHMQKCLVRCEFKQYNPTFGISVLITLHDFPLQWIGATVCTLLNGGLCAAIIVGICQC